jgi:hypothetical protein
MMHPDLDHSRRLAGERGFALITVIAVMAVVMLLSIGTFAAVNGDVLGSGEDITYKQAEDAAEVGVADFLAQLADDSSSWTKCTAGGPALNDPWTGRTPPAGTKWATVPGTTNQYSIELLPARGSGYTKCDPDPAKVQASMVDPGTRGLRIRVTGKATGAKGTEMRSVITTFRRTSFLDYLWFTDKESADPIWLVKDTGGHATQPANTADGDFASWGAANCDRYYRPAPSGTVAANYDRSGTTWRGKLDPDGNGFSDETTRTYSCDTFLAIQFAGFDQVLGPMHTNDEFLMCDGFTAGRNANDRIESGRSWRPCDGRSTTQPNMQGTLVQNAPSVGLPPTDASLAKFATGYTFNGRTTIQMLSTGQIKITNAGISGGAATYDPPPNGVIYVKNGVGTCAPYQPLNPYAQATGAWNAASGVSASCGDAWVSGTYTKDLTIAAANDVIVNGDITSQTGSDARLGLIADNFVRVWHPVDRTTVNSTTCSEPSTGKITGRRIDAAILSLAHSFMVDNYYCGSAIGTLTINGVIAQKFRGAVGTPSGSTGGASTGFEKNYNYDERLAYKGPPHFLDPVAAAWKMRGFTEQQGPHT